MLSTKPNLADVLMSICRYVNAAVMVLVALYFFLIPGVTVIHELSDPNIRSAGIPGTAWELHQTLSPKLEKWAGARLDSKRAAELSTSNISGTERPLFGSVFYLWATESLQDAWEKGHSPGAVAPNIYAKGAIEAATSLVIDPTQANWVKIHWGENSQGGKDAWHESCGFHRARNSWISRQDIGFLGTGSILCQC
jgi:hypothetical protein